MKWLKILGLVAVIVIVGVWALNRAYEPRYSIPSLKKAAFGFKLPPSARLLHGSAYDSASIRTRTAVIEYGDPDVSGLVSQLKKGWWELSDTSNLGIDRMDFPPRVEWWNPDSAHKFIAARKHWSIEERGWVLIKLDKPGYPIVYTHWEWSE